MTCVIHQHYNLASYAQPVHVSDYQRTTAKQLKLQESKVVYGSLPGLGGRTGKNRYWSCITVLLNKGGTVHTESLSA